jgi:hypothetical protein
MKFTAKATKRVVTVLMAITMFATAFTFTACNGDDEGNGGGTGTTAATDDKDKDPDDNKTTSVTPLGEAQSFDFGVINFAERTFTLPSDGDVKIGGSMDGEGGGGEGAIRIFGQQGITSGRPDDGYADYGYGEFRDIDGVYTAKISQNGPFWDNISKIEATFYLESEESPESLGNIEIFMLTGALQGASGWQWYNAGDNLMNQVIDEDDEDGGFKWGAEMTATWDFDWFKSGENGADKKYSNSQTWDDEKEELVLEYVFDQPVKDFDGTEKGGGIGKFGLMIGNNETDVYDVIIRFTDVKIYVHDMDIYQGFVDEVVEIAKTELPDYKIDEKITAHVLLAE